MANKLPARLDVSVVMIGIGAVAMYSHYLLVGIFLILMGCFNITRWQKLKFLRQLPEILRTNLDGLDEVYGGIRWIGKDSKVVAHSIPEVYDYGKVSLLVVCRTDRGDWFVVRAALMAGRTLEFRVVGFSEPEVRALFLRIDRELCEQHFGKQNA